MKTLQGFISDTAPIVVTALGAMQSQASSMGVHVGVSEITVSHTDVDNYKLKLSLTNNTNVRPGGAGEARVNFAGVASAKAAQMQRTGKFSGNDDGFIGEVPYRGGMCFKKDGYTVLVAYSGGTQDEDVKIATIGIGAMGILK